MSNEEIITFLLQSQKSLDSQLHKVVETMGRIEASMIEWYEDRHQMHTTMTNVFERMDKFAADAEKRSKEADARMARLEKLFERSIKRDGNGHHLG